VQTLEQKLVIFLVDGDEDLWKEEYFDLVSIDSIPEDKGFVSLRTNKTYWRDSHKILIFFTCGGKIRAKAFCSGLHKQVPSLLPL